MAGRDFNEPIDWTAAPPPPEGTAWSPPGAPDDPPGQAPRRRRRLRWVLVGGLIGLVIVLGVGRVVLDTSFKGYFVPSGANTPTLQPGDHVLVRKGSHVGRGDMIVFVSPAAQRLVIMRVVGVAGDHLSDPDGKVFVNGRAAPDAYLAAGTVTQNVPDMVVPAGAVYVLGDNRGDSADSRAYGPVPTGQIKGRLVFRYWPLSRIGGV